LKINFILPGLFFSGGVRVCKMYCERLNEMGHDCKIFYPFFKCRGKFEKNTHCYIWPSQIPDADVVIATSWETAYVVNALPERCGRKHYLIQHYEQWDYHNGGQKDPKIDATYSFPLKHIINSYNLRDMLPVQRPDDVVVRWGREVPGDYEKDYSEPKILYNRRMEIWKGGETLHHVLNRISVEYPDVPIKFYGVPHTTDKRLDGLFRWANIFVNASWVEGFGEPPLEAAGYGCATIAPENSAMPEMFTEHTEMIFCKAKDQDCLYKSLVYLISRASRREIFGKNARAKAKRYTFDKSVWEFEEALEE
jgi:hypothetical protein